MSALIVHAMKEVVDLCSMHCHQMEKRYDDIIRRSRKKSTDITTRRTKTAKAPSTTSITDEILTAVQEKVCCEEALFSYSN